MIRYILIILVLVSCQEHEKKVTAGMIESSRYYEGPIIDMHLHASYLDDYGGGGPNCANNGRIIYSGWDPSQEIDLQRLKDCDSIIHSSETDEDLMLESLEMLEKHNILAVAFGELDRIYEWYRHSPDRIIPGISFTSSSSRNYSLADFRKFHNDGILQVFAENGAQYHGKKLNDPAYDSIWSLAQELDIPVGVHLGEGPTGGAHLLGGASPSSYRVSLGSPFQLDDILIKYPKLRVYVMHYASPLVDEMIAMLYSHPQLYVDIAQNNWAFPREHFYSQLKRLIDAGFEERIMWGSDQMAWPKTIEIAIETIQEAPFLTENQKKKIFYSNAVKFLRLKF